MQQRAIKNKIKSTTSIKKITKTMEMISVTKMKKGISAANAYKNFMDKAYEVLKALNNKKEIEKSIFSLNNNSDKELYIIMGGHKGLAGSFNVNIYRALNKLSLDKENTDFISINKYGEKIVKKFLNKDKNNILMSFINKDFGEKDARIIFDKVIELYKKGIYKNIYILYTDFHSVSSFELKIEKILPFELKDDKNVSENNHKDNNEDNISKEYIYEPNSLKVLESSIKLIYTAYILYAFSRSATAEHMSRMNAMHTATENAQGLISDLKLLYNKSRQAAITQEISEISAGASL